MRSRVRVALIVWTVLLLIIGGYGLLPATAEFFDLRKVKTAQEKVYLPVARLTSALQDERRLSVQLVGLDNGSNVVPTGSDVSPLLPQLRKLDQDLWTQRRQTDQTISVLQHNVDHSVVRNNRELSRTAHSALSRLSDLENIRASVDTRDSTTGDVVSSYTRMIDAVLPVFQAMPANDDLPTTKRELTLAAVQRLQEASAHEYAVIAGATYQGQLSASAYRDFADQVAIRRQLTDELLSELTGARRREFNELNQSEPLTKVRGFEDQVINQTPSKPTTSIDGSQWAAANTAVVTGLANVESKIRDQVVAGSNTAAWEILLKAILITAAVLIIGLVLMITWFRVAPRHVLRELNTLKESALDFAENRLPRVVSKLQHGEHVDVQKEVPPLEPKKDEFGDVGRAFNSARRVAVQAAVDQARLRNGIRDVFVNLARRSQSLIHRQLSLLDKMERDAADPKELEKLFAVDHLATRIRRHAEDLIILSGAAPGRQWRKPVPVINVIRSAIGEIESYERVSVLKIDAAQLTGRAVADVIPLLSALLDNATTYSRPQTKVRVVGALVPNGYVVEIEDSGLGMSDQELARFNQQLKKRPEFNPSETVQLGLFVVAHLAHRHDINVTLHKSPYGGTTAIVLIPNSLVDAQNLPSESGMPEEEGMDPVDLPVRPRDERLDASTEFVASDIAENRAFLLAAADEDAVAGDDVAAQDNVNRAEPDEENGPEEAGPRETLGDGTELPRRERQASLAEELRTGFTDGIRKPRPKNRKEQDEEEGSERTPEQIRAMMTTFQRGSLEGQQAADALDLPPVSEPTDAPVP